MITVYAASKLLPKILLEIKKQYPEFKFIIKQHENEKEINADLFIYSTKEKAHGPNIINLLEEEILLAVPNEHPFASKQDICLEKLASEPIISLQKGKGLRDITTSYCRMAGFEPNIILESDDPATVRGFIGVGLGIGFLPAITWQGGVDNSIKLLSIANIQCKRYINLSFREGRYRSKATKVVCDHIVKYFEQLQQFE
ncbi:LysR substrate-binding domain-containing protein [Bacillus solitudinis]|uniref:LysR substrate-binding domain-containing protein n=1 Tax=Bacillus solitudinis TaxID=2014074 RepID=UPI000C247BCF|nr:LysR substrate-binding domain-containing protein [Bacillus solitudinis]